MHEVEVGAARDPIEDREIVPVLDLVPPHVRHLEPGGEAANDTGNDVEPLALTELLALGEEELVPEANPEERPPVVERGAERVEEAQRLEIAHGVVESAVAGQDKSAGVSDHARVLGHHGAHAEAPQRFLDAAQVPPSVIDNRDHVTYKLPFVERTPAMRGLSRVASASARPTALNAASAMWCRFWP